MPKYSKESWVFLDSEFLSTPSVLGGGYTMAKEAIIRVKACRMLERVGKALFM
jgi:hypothetical protein